MVFTSLEFLAFLPAVAALASALPRGRVWPVLLAASFVYYAAFRPEHLLALLASAAIAYAAGLGLGRAQREGTRKTLLALAISASLGLLVILKYLGFLGRSVEALLVAAGLEARPPLLDLALPVGLSFYALRAVSYVVDVYRDPGRVERSPGLLALYLAFFPAVVAGPIERAPALLPQLRAPSKATLDRVSAGLALMLLGFFKKLVVADRLAAYVDAVYDGGAGAGAGPALLATYFFAFQIYCDFSGYSDIAVGAARLLGVELSANFARPYSARSVAELWRRWHITLSSWFRDYLYVPLGGSRCASPRWAANVMVVFLLSGLWHGASWTFVVWGAIHGLYLVSSRATAGLRAGAVRGLGLDGAPRLHAALQRFVVFHLVTFAWVFFRARSLGDAIEVLGRIARGGFDPAALPVEGFTGYDLVTASLGLLALVLLERLSGPEGSTRFLPGRPAWLRWPILWAMAASILVFGELDVTTFVYSRF